MGQPGVRPDGPAHLRGDDQRRPGLDPAVRADGLCDGARGAGGQDVLQHPALRPPGAGLAGRRHPDRLHLLGHRQRPGRRRGGADGGDRAEPDAARRLRRPARHRRDHRRRHAGHPDPALGDDHRLCRGGGAVGGQALRRGDVPGLLPGPAVPRLHHRLGAAAAEDRAAPAGGADPGAGAGLDAGLPGRLFAQHAGRAGQGPGLAVPGDRARHRDGAPDLWPPGRQFRHRAGAAGADRADPGRDLVVRRDLSAGLGRGGGGAGRAGATRRAGRHRRRRRPAPSSGRAPASMSSSAWWPWPRRWCCSATTGA